MTRPITHFLVLFLALLACANAFSQIPFQRLDVVSGDYSDLSDQTAANGPEFGYSVATSGEWMAVGAPATIPESGGSRRGAIFLFRNQGDEWELMQRIIPSVNFASGQDARCGHSLALRGSSLVFGCPGAGLLFEPDNENGTTMFYRRDVDNEWQFQSAFSGSSGERCGTDVSIASNPLLLSTPVVAVSGCPQYNTAQGRVRSYTYDGTDWTFNTAITSSDGSSGDTFGTAVALHRSCSGLPPVCLTRLAVGAPTKQHDNAILGGSVYVYSGSGFTETDIFTHPAEDTFGATFYGQAVDINSTQLVIGSTGGFTSECPNAPRCGLVNHLEVEGGTWSFLPGGGAINAGGMPAGEQSGMNYGRAVALGFNNWIAIAAPYADGPDVDDNLVENLGMVELRRNDNGDWGASWDDTQGEVRPDVGNIVNQSDSHFGTSVAFGGGRWLAVGYPRARSGLFPAPRRGLVYMYAHPDGIFSDRFEQ